MPVKSFGAPDLRPFKSFRERVRWVLMGYAALTIVLWVILGQPYTPLGYFTKLVELALIVLLWLDLGQVARAT